MGRTVRLTDTQWDQLDHLRMSTPSADVFRNCTIILMSAVGRSKTSISSDLGLLYGYCRSRAQALPRRRRQSLASDQAARAAQPGYAGVYQPDETGSTNQSSDCGIWFFHLVGGKAGPASGQGNRDSVRRRSIAKAPAPRRIFHPSAQAYPQGQKGPKGMPQGQERPYWLEKKR